MTAVRFGTCVACVRICIGRQQRADWVADLRAGIAADQGTVGITEHAQQQLGDVVYVELPEAGEQFAASSAARTSSLRVAGASFKQKQAFGSVESVKASSSVYAPVDLTVPAVHTVL